MIQTNPRNRLDYMSNEHSGYVPITFKGLATGCFLLGRRFSVFERFEMLQYTIRYRMSTIFHFLKYLLEFLVISSHPSQGNTEVKKAAWYHNGSGNLRTLTRTNKTCLQWTLFFTKSGQVQLQLVLANQPSIRWNLIKINDINITSWSQHWEIFM